LCDKFFYRPIQPFQLLFSAVVKQAVTLIDLLRTVCRYVVALLWKVYCPNVGQFGISIGVVATALVTSSS